MVRIQPLFLLGLFYETADEFLNLFRSKPSIKAVFNVDITLSALVSTGAFPLHQSFILFFLDELLP